MPTAERRDRRTERTREAVLDAFRRLLEERGYSDLGIGEIAERANVGRSTLYANFGSKEGILRHSIRTPFAILAAISDQGSDHQAVTRLIEHFRLNSKLARPLFGGPTRSILVRTLAEMTEAHLAPLWSSAAKKPCLPLALAAQQIAEAQIGLVDHWLTGGLPCRGDELAAALITTTLALIDAQTGRYRVR